MSCFHHFWSFIQNWKHLSITLEKADPTEDLYTVQNDKVSQHACAMGLGKTLNLVLLNLIPPGGWGSGKCPRQFQISRTFLIFKQYLPNVATFTKIYWGTRFWKKLASRVSHVAMATTSLTPCLLKCWLLKYFSQLINEIFKTRANYQS